MCATLDYTNSIPDSRLANNDLKYYFTLKLDERVLIGAPACGIVM
jgi:hypothetical protein